MNRVQRRAARLRRDLVPVRHRLRGRASVCPVTHLAPLARLVGQVVERPLLPGNSIEPLVDGVEAYPAMLEAIAAARTSVMLASYIFDADGVGARFVDALDRAQRRGVAVRVLIDDVSCASRCIPRRSRLRRAGMPVGIFNPPFVPARLNAFNLRNHRKILVVDGELGFTGGMNIDRRYWGEAPAGVPRPALSPARPGGGAPCEVFADDWLFTTDEALRGAAVVSAARSPPAIALARGIEAGPDEAFERAALGDRRRAQRGAALGAHLSRPISSPTARSSPRSTPPRCAASTSTSCCPRRPTCRTCSWAMFGQLWQVLDHGCRSGCAPAPFDHSKLMVVDGAWTLLGSANWDARSLRLNFEFNVECYSVELGAHMDGLW